MPIEVAITIELKKRKEDGGWEEYEHEDTITINASSKNNVPEGDWDKAVDYIAMPFFSLVSMEEKIYGVDEPVYFKSKHCEFIHYVVFGKNGATMRLLTVLSSVLDSMPVCNLQAASEGEYEEEEFYVVATLPANALEQARGGSQQPHYALVDIDSDRPMLELEGAIYQGTNDELLGTAMLFDVTEDADARLVGTTSRVVAFRPVQVTRKG
ncbi:hypothetical protein H4R18_002430 [Coemansia javaensis]|uniref:Transcription factor TFIIIC triple barrel domain-containing protein n=1 Tax=Coemansia javaensis TaxID=2761396 RepID=A0A9W8HIE4_9FUNG|nr:hypothetical protein H4R18_002430 [Coemansia javaensis]